WSRERLVAMHPRSYGRGETLLVLDHYLDALARKPRAVLNARVVRQLPEVYERVRQRLCSARPDGYRDFCALLLLHREFPADQVRQAVEQAMAMDMLEPATVRQLLLNQTAPAAPGPVPVPPAFRDVQLAAADLARYNALLEGMRAS
ncbi:MAG: IS21 family transposase, partial [Bacillota bacterium]